MKKFIIYWDETYDVEKVELHPIDFFRTKNGFEYDDILRIDALEIGESHYIDNNHVLIVRVA